MLKRRIQWLGYVWMQMWLSLVQETQATPSWHKWKVFHPPSLLMDDIWRVQRGQPVQASDASIRYFNDRYIQMGRRHTVFVEFLFNIRRTKQADRFDRSKRMIRMIQIKMIFVKTIYLSLFVVIHEYLN